MGEQLRFTFGSGRRRAGRGSLGEFVRMAATLELDRCVLWPFGRNRRGYGQYHHPTAGGVRRGGNAHRAVLVLESGRDPEGLDAAHLSVVCHDRLCVNPRHLRWATRTEQQADRITDGTTSRGEACATAKLSSSEVVTIRGLVAAGVTLTALAARFGVSRTTVRHIRDRTRWAWLE